MRLRLPLLIAALIALLVIGAGAAGADRGLPARAAWFEDPAHEPGTPVPGGYAVQQRGYFSITAQLHLKQLTPGHRYTLWWVVYNNPAACVEGCDMDDVTTTLESGANPAGIGFLYGGNFLVGTSGKLDLPTRILENSVIGCQTVAPYDALCNPLVDAAVAEATILVLDHGPADSTSLQPVTEAFSEGCKTYKRFDTVVVSYAETGFDCFTPQTVHLP